MESPVGRLRLTACGSVITCLAWCDAQEDYALGEAALLMRAVGQLEAYFAGESAVFDLPLAPAGSPFQHRVWTEMSRIPYGRTRTYGAMAWRVDGVAQAVGQACGANPIPIIIPCHRVVAGGGRLGGFSGGRGAASKRALLTLEGAVPEGTDLFAPHTAGPALESALSVGAKDPCPK